MQRDSQNSYRVPGISAKTTCFPSEPLNTKRETSHAMSGVYCTSGMVPKQSMLILLGKDVSSINTSCNKAKKNTRGELWNSKLNCHSLYCYE